jgi:predicted Zn-dependent protease
MLAILLGAAALACAPEPAPRRGAAPARRPTVLATEYDDQRAGAEAQREVAATLGQVRDPKVQELVDAVGRRLVAKLPKHKFDYQFRVVDQWPPNAFALPGGAIYVSRGLLVLSNSEDELANVLAHEITHAAARHAAARQVVAGGVNPFAIAFTNPAYLAAYSRDQEREADRGGQMLAASAGYDPSGLGEFLSSLGNVEKLLAGAQRIPGYLDTHPATGERTAGAASAAQHLEWSRQPGITHDRDDYLRRLDGLVVGEDPAEGVFEKGRFVHPDLGFVLRIPEGWRFVNSPAAVGALSPDGGARVVLELAGDGNDPTRFAEEFVAQRVPEIQAQVEGQRAITVNGLPAVEVRGYAGPITGKITWIASGGHVYRLSNLAQGMAAERALARGEIFVRSFRPIAPEDRAGIRVRRLRLAKARKGEGLADFSQRTRNDWDAQRTAIANGLFASARLVEGELLKIAVVEDYAVGRDAPDQPAPAPRR